MGWGKPDVYYQPEEFGLKKVAEYEQPDMSYEFAMAVVWEHEESGRLYWATDSGCSCPSPFEDYTTLESLGDPLTLENFAEFEKEVLSVSPYVGRGDYTKTLDADAKQMIQDVRMKLKGVA